MKKYRPINNLYSYVIFTRFSNDESYEFRVLRNNTSALKGRNEIARIQYSSK